MFARPAYTLVFTVTLLFFSHLASGQWESHNFVTYDTTIRFVCIPGYGGCGDTLVWTVRISRPVGYFTPGSPDTASRPVIISMPGDAQVGTDTSYLTLYGPHYWLKNGWNGSVWLRNGHHYPLLITIMPNTYNVRPFSTQPLMDTLLREFHPRSVHVMAFSGGFQDMGWYLWFEATRGDEHNMANIKSLVDFEGLAPANNYGQSTIGYPNAFGHWAKKYGGKFFGLEGNNDPRDVWQVSENMNDSLPNSAYFSYEDLGNGAHCCFDGFYNPGETNWTDHAPFGNPYITTLPPHSNTSGTYIFDPYTGTDVFQWALRQGDTTLVDTNQYFVANPGPNRVIYAPQDSVYVSGTAIDSASTIRNWFWSQISGNLATIEQAGKIGTFITGLTPGNYTFMLTVTDLRGKTATAPITVSVIGTPPPPADTFFVANAGPDRIIYSPQDTVDVAGVGTDSAGFITTWSWTLISGPGATISSPTSPATAITGLTKGSYAFALTLVDSRGKTASDTMTVGVYDTTTAVNPGSAHFVANSGPDRVIYWPQDSIDVSGSAIDSAGAISSYLWTTVSGAGATIQSPASAATAITGLSKGSYYFALIVTDSRGISALDTMNVLVYDTVNNSASGSSQMINVQMYGGLNPYADSSWNHWNCQLSPMLSNMLYSNGAPSDYSVVQTDASGETAITAPSEDNGNYYSGSMAPPPVLRYASHTPVGRRLIFSGLDSTKTYTFSFFSSISGLVDTTTFTIDTVSIMIPAQNNLTEPAVFKNIFPKAGEIQVLITSGSGMDTYLNGFTINESDSIPPGDSTGSGSGSTQSNDPLGIYPNPFSAEGFTVSFSNKLTGEVEISLVDVMGNQLAAYTFQKQTATFIQQIYTPALPKGIYFIKAIMQGYRASKEIIKL